jgi:hypothetical protein
LFGFSEPTGATPGDRRRRARRRCRCPAGPRARGVEEVRLLAGALRRVAPDESPRLPGARDVFPLGLAQQPVFLAGLAREPVDVVVRIGPGDAGRGLVVADRAAVARVFPVLAGHRLVAVAELAGERVAALGRDPLRVGRERAVLRVGDLELADGERVADLDVPHRPLVALGLAAVEAHAELARRHDDHLGAAGAVVEGGAGFCGAYVQGATVGRFGAGPGQDAAEHQGECDPAQRGARRQAMRTWPPGFDQGTRIRADTGVVGVQSRHLVDPPEGARGRGQACAAAVEPQCPGIMPCYAGGVSPSAPGVRRAGRGGLEDPAASRRSLSPLVPVAPAIAGRRHR